ncbi:nucleotidyltransferase domain-containing protein [Desulfoscipio gibsoniae]
MHRQRPEIEKIIISFKKALAKQGIKADKIILFGSQAQGTATENSDIDVVVISGSFSGLDFMQRCELLGKAIAEIMEPIEPLAYTQEEFNEQKYKASILYEVLNEPQTIEFSV